jgi:hypothetical protein
MVTGEPMSDDEVVRLSEEIRDIQKETAANYKLGLQNQQEAMAIRKRGVQRSKAAFVGLVVLFIFPGGTHLVSLLPWLFHGRPRH